MNNMKNVFVERAHAAISFLANDGMITIMNTPAGEDDDAIRREYSNALQMIAVDALHKAHQHFPTILTGIGKTAQDLGITELDFCLQPTALAIVAAALSECKTLADLGAGEHEADDVKQQLCLIAAECKRLVMQDETK